MSKEIPVTFPPFPAFTVNTSSGPVTVPCEPIGGYFAIAAEFGMIENGGDGQAVLHGTFGVFLYPSPAPMRMSEGSGCIRCARRAALEMAKLPLDWSALTPENCEQWRAAQPEQTLLELDIARNLEWGCDADYCDAAAGDDRSEPDDDDE